MLFRISTDDAVPIYRQIVRQVHEALASGKLKAGDKLPSQRELAQALVVNHLTVKKAYEILEAEALIGTDRGRGTFVAEPKTKGRKATALHNEGTQALGRRVVEICASARLLGLDEDAVVKLVRLGFGALEAGEE